MIVYIIYFHAITVNLISYLKFNVTTFCFFRQAKDIGSEVTSQNSKYMITSRYQNVVQNQNIANWKLTHLREKLDKSISFNIFFLFL